LEYFLYNHYFFNDLHGHPSGTPKRGGAVVPAAALVTGARVYADRPDLLTVKEQTPIHITLDQTVASDQVRSGDHFQAMVTEPVDVNGRTVIPQGAHVGRLVVDARK
jgi:hypothetical protein